MSLHKKTKTLNTPRILAALSSANEGRIFCDDWIKRELEIAKNNGTGESVCPGCTMAACCHHPVLATYLDVFPVAVKLHKEGENTTSLRRRLVAAGEIHEKALVEGIEAENCYTCPLLVDSRCSAYELRPSICRTYHVFHSRNPCIPYYERTDGQRPLVFQIDNAPIVKAAMTVAIAFANKNGAPSSLRPWMRPLPLQLATVMKALWRPEAERWHKIWRNCHMPIDALGAVIEQQKKAKKLGRRGKLEYYSS